MKEKYRIIPFIIVAVALGIFVYLKTRKLKDFEPQIIAKLQSLVREGSDSLYRLSISGIEVDVVNGRIALVGASLEFDSAVLIKMDSAKAAPNDIFRISLDTLHVDGLSPADLLNTRSINLNVLNINNPTIEVFHEKRKYNSSIKKNTTSLYQKIATQIGTVSVDSLSIKRANFIHHNLSKGNKKSALKDVSLTFNNILIDSTTEYDTTRFLFAKKALISMKDYSFRTSDGLYLLKADNLSVSAPEDVMRISGFSVKPTSGREALDKISPFRKEQYDINITKININGINWWDVLNNEALKVGKMTISDSRIKVYLNRALPPSTKSKVGKYPHQLLMNAKFPVKVDEINISGLDLSYEEYNPKSGKSAVIYFDNTSGTISNITNSARDIAHNPHMKVRARTSFMHDALLQTDFIFDLANYKKGKFSVDIQLTKINKEHLEKIANPLGLVSIKSLNVKKLEAHVDGNDVLGKGNVLLLYDDLKVIPLKRDDDEKNGMKQKWFQAFVINSFILKDKNPSGNDKPRNPTAEFVRESDKSFFNLVWKTILVGILKTVGAKPELAKSK